ncbi:MAG: hypothetical protein JWQ50_1441 [Caballeronia mineralivorans]|nr:hypothetical protein [Caballeronia mineralivorans]
MDTAAKPLALAMADWLAWLVFLYDSRTQAVALKKTNAKRTASLATCNRINPSPGLGNHPCS